jgi:serine/threonine-protein kinase
MDQMRVYMGRYEAKRLLGEGGMGRVYLAREYDPDRHVVVKVMHEHLVDDPKFRERFQRETRTLARLKHPQVVKLLDVSLDDPGGPCLVMEYIRGVGLDELLKANKKFSPARVCRIITQLCEVLQEAHDLNIIHRDLKPANLMVINADTPEEQVKVMDFGLAKIVDPHRTLSKVTDTSVEFAVGTPSYISPEQVRGEEIDHRADLYSVGVIAYELLSGQLPFHRATNMDMILAHATEEVPTFKDLGLRSWVPRAVEQVVMSCLEKDPAERPQSARELAELFESALAHPNEESVVRTPVGKLDAAPETLDPDALVFQIEAWLPQRIAIVKIRGFVHDAGGEVVESGPGLIRVRVGVRERPQPRGFISFGQESRRGKPVDMELRLQSLPSEKDNKLRVTLVFHPPTRAALQDDTWRDQCNKVFCEVRSYLMGSAQG